MAALHQKDMDRVPVKQIIRQCSSNCYQDNKLHFHCNFCNYSITSNSYSLAKRHALQAHASRAVQFQEELCFPCKIDHATSGQCKRAHYHCPVYQKTVINQQRFRQHLKNSQISSPHSEKI